MEIVFIVFFSFIFLIIYVFFITGYVRFKALFQVFLFSLFSVAASILLQTVLHNYCSNLFFNNSNIFIKNFLHIALTEELSKLFFFTIFIKMNRKENKQLSLQETFFLSLCYALVFASFENIAYAVQNINLLLFRNITGSILHFGLSLYLFKIVENKNKRNFLIMWFLHGLYNLFLDMGGSFFIFSLVIAFFALINVFIKYYELKKIPVFNNYDKGENS